jgi:hypothetical protein
MTKRTAKCYECTNSYELGAEIRWYDSCAFYGIMIGFMLTLLSAMRNPGVAVQVAKSLINPMIVLTVILLLAMVLQEWF